MGRCLRRLSSRIDCASSSLPGPVPETGIRTVPFGASPFQHVRYEMSVENRVYDEPPSPSTVSTTSESCRTAIVTNSQARE